ncbi:MAG TPA: hypothetical protein VMU08_12570 [Rhizomicrobium sp.]|nr:hypothetical protein [Rhizomicrobium sp.]
MLSRTHFERLHEIELAAIAAVGEIRREALKEQITESIETVVHGHHHDVAAPAEIDAVIERARAGAVRIGAAVNVNITGRLPPSRSAGVQTFRNRQSSDVFASVLACGEPGP